MGNRGPQCVREDRRRCVMARLRNSAGVVVNVSDELAAKLGKDWVSADEPAKRKPGRPKKNEAKADAEAEDN